MDVSAAPVELGTILFTIVEPHRGYEAAYNRWYERDHFYAGCLIGPFNFAGKRWVATRDLKDRRITGAGEVAADPLVGSFLAMYWILAGHHDDWARWAGQQVHVLHREGRMFAERDHVHTKLYRYDWAVHRDGEGVPPELVCEHPWRGLVVVLGDATTDRSDADRCLRDDVVPALQRDSGVALTLSFSVLPMASDAPGVAAETGSDRRFLHLHLLDRDPGEVWDTTFVDHEARLRSDAAAQTVWASPFHPTVPGTDTHVDRLW